MCILVNRKSTFYIYNVLFSVFKIYFILTQLHLPPSESAMSEDVGIEPKGLPRSKDKAGTPATTEMSTTPTTGRMSAAAKAPSAANTDFNNLEIMFIKIILLLNGFRNPPPPSPMVAYFVDSAVTKTHGTPVCCRWRFAKESTLS